MSAHRVRIVNGKIAEVNTGSPECVVPLPAQYLGRRLEAGPAARRKEERNDTSGMGGGAEHAAEG